MSADAVNGDSEVPNVRMRSKVPSPLAANPSAENGSSNGTPSAAAEQNGKVAAALSRSMAVLQEVPPELEESSEEIRKLDSQLGHLNDYVEKMEVRLREGSDRLQKTLNEQKEEREKRRRSFMQRLATNQQEDMDFQNKMQSMLTRVDTARNRQSIYEIIKGMEVPKVDENGAAGESS
uniref:Uncharacterized protein n=1 Tax=Plectus sambesii TaxID=2011161 RepID=A0A914VE47_9BILA